MIKPTRCTNFTNLFCLETQHVWDSSSVHHQEFIHCTLGNGICHTGLWTAFEQGQGHPGPARKLLSRTRMELCPGPAQKLSTILYDMPVLSVQWINSWWWAEELPETCRVSCQNKFVKLVHLVGFITKKCVSVSLCSVWKLICVVVK